ncbi:uncharacterized protein STEHIDRAFT_162368 [Stereum hirsutum FP-91666 SS1]|uniref:uncharacterized protein n=1 Tax=Stereum hirsutum (strain FP-91666) TaxID=721885 RepID=UPI000444A17A|nr:uncharacterized protein STEHIDRAFT_162368 [Stereum hirsutum FP-91666 SS1]EIM80586.1 hypothetical protein STEHIDRAFT_162368 [Stereum hirsutum FP-91666 SS1]
MSAWSRLYLLLGIRIVFKLSAASHDAPTANSPSEPNKPGESASVEKSLPPWFQKTQPDVHIPRKRSRSPEHTSHPASLTNSNSNGDDNDAQLHASKRLKSISHHSATSPTATSPPKSAPSPAKAHNYSTLLKHLDVKKAGRLITARENAIKSVKTLVPKEKEKRTNVADLGGNGIKNVVARVDEGGRIQMDHWRMRIRQLNTAVYKLAHFLRHSPTSSSFDSRDLTLSDSSLDNRRASFPSSTIATTVRDGLRHQPQQRPPSTTTLPHLPPLYQGASILSTLSKSLLTCCPSVLFFPATTFLDRRRVKTSSTSMLEGFLGVSVLGLGCLSGLGSLGLGFWASEVSVLVLGLFAGPWVSGLDLGLGDIDLTSEIKHDD